MTHRWRPIETAPKDRLVRVLAIDPHVPCDDYQPLPPLYTRAQWNEEAGWCVCELREVIYWAPLRKDEL